MIGVCDFINSIFQRHKKYYIDECSLFTNNEQITNIFRRFLHQFSNNNLNKYIRI